MSALCINVDKVRSDGIICGVTQSRCALQRYCSDCGEWKMSNNYLTCRHLKENNVMSEKKTNNSTRTTKSAPKAAPKSTQKKEKATIITILPNFSLAQKADGSVVKVRGISAKVGDEIEI